jgi:AcrR family transcriptional regulator
VFLQRPRVSLRRQPRQDRSVFTFDVILEAATQILQSRGVDELRMTDLAERAGVSPGALYQYFPDRPALMNALLDRLCNELKARLEQALAKHQALPLDELLREVALEAAGATIALRGLKLRLHADYTRLAAEGGLMDISHEYAELLTGVLVPKLGRPREVMLPVGRAMIWAADGIFDGYTRCELESTPAALGHLVMCAWRGLIADIDAPPGAVQA